MTTATEHRLLTIGTVCERLKGDFPDISISKIRYLEDQGLLAPRRTQGGYRLFSEDDVERLHTILRLQRDEFLPLRVIRQELASQAPDRRRRRPAGLTGVEEEIGAAELAERAGVEAAFVRELEEYGLLSERAGGYPESDVEVVQICARLASYGIDPRHLRTVRSSADRVAGLVEAVTAPALRSRNPERREAALADLQSVGALTQELMHQLLWRQLRQRAAE